jgi:hypothetical protein
MILFSVSLPGRFGDWCDHVIARLAEVALGSVVPTGANTAEELATDLINTEGQHFYVGARHPSRWLRDKLAAAEKKFVIAVDDPRHAVNDLIVRQQLDLPEATRRVASSCAAMSRYITLPGALVVSGERDWPKRGDTIAAIAGHLGLSVDRAAIDKLAADLDASGLGPHGDAEQAWLVGLPEPSVTVIDGAVSSYAAYFHGDSLGQITWARDLFYEEHHRPATHPIEISGKVRYLIYGPYVALPSGSWTADMVLGFSEEAVDMTYRVEVWAGAQLNSTSIHPDRPGVVTANVNFEIEEANDSLVEIRVLNERSAIYGRLALANATLTLRRSVASSIADHLRTELGLAGGAAAEAAMSSSG